MILPLLLILLSFQVQSQSVIPVDNPNNITLAYGSCLSTFDESSDIQEGIQAIIATQPDLWMWIGDAVYLDGENFFFGALPGAGYDTSDADFVRGVFDTLKNNPNYVQLRENTPIIGTWDDHDYAYEGQTKDFKYKERNKGLYLDFLDEPADSLRRNQNGVYTSYYIGEDRFIKVILLDVRYNADDYSTIDDTLGNSQTGDMLGEEQWTWLDTQLQDPAGTYTLIVSATQIIPDDRPVLPNWFQNSRERLFDLIKARQKSGVVLLTGDVHFAEIITHPCPARVGYRTFHEFTSSGITHAADFVDIVDDAVDTYSREQDRYFDKNFGTVRFVRAENSTDIPNLIFEARNMKGEVVLNREVPYSDLVYDAAAANGFTGCPAIDSDASDSETNTDDNDDNIIDGVGDAVDTVDNADVNNFGDVVDTADNVVDDIFGKGNSISGKQRSRVCKRSLRKTR